MDVFVISLLPRWVWLINSKLMAHIQSLGLDGAHLGAPIPCTWGIIGQTLQNLAVNISWAAVCVCESEMKYSIYLVIVNVDYLTKVAAVFRIKQNM